MTILTYKPANQQETSVLQNYLRERYTELNFRRPILKAMYSYRFYNKLYQLVIDTGKKEFEWCNIQSVERPHVDYKCATLTKLVRFVDPNNWDVVANAMDVMQQGFEAKIYSSSMYVNNVYVGEVKRLTCSTEDAKIIIGSPDVKGSFYAENTRLRGSRANDIIVDDLY